MEWAAMLMEMVMEEVTKPDEKKSSDSSVAAPTPAPVEGFGELVKKAVGTAIPADLSEDEMDVAYSLSNFFGK